MSNGFQDELWPHFAPLWIDLRAIAPRLLLTGGYGLFLKQQWLISQLRFLGTEDGHSIVTENGKKLIVDDGVRTLVAIDRWNDQILRVTKDLDFIAGLDLIASVEEQQRLHAALEKHDFKVVPANARWQFEKKLSAGRTVVLEFHAPSPAGKRDDLRVQSRRVKPQPSLGQAGIHGRENPEAICSELYPFSFSSGGVEIVLPNPVTLGLMKLVAMRDRRLASQDSSKSADERRIEEGQARKHAEDVCRVMAMMTREEGEHAGNILDEVRRAPVFVEASKTFATFFENDEDWASQVSVGMWQTEDFHLIQSTLASWFH
jgi:hypothetical protein